MRGLMIFIILVILSPICIAAPIDQTIEQASAEVEDFFDSVDDITIVSGSQISFEDKVMFNLVKSRLSTRDYAILPDTKRPDTALVLLGSEKTNKVTKEILPLLTDVSTSEYPPAVIKKGMLEDKRVMIIYSQKEALLLQNTAAAKSPLAGLIDPKLIPILATTGSLLLMYLWNIIGKTIGDLLNDFISSHITGRKTQGKKTAKLKPEEFVNYKEVIAFLVYVAVFSIVIAYSWAGSMSHFIDLLKINLIVIGAISLLREAIRIGFCHRHKLRSEYVLWPFGTLVTLVSTYFGNTFSLVSYTLLDEDEADLKRFGKASFFISLLTYGIVVLAYLLNIIFPSQALQMAFVYSIMILVIEMFPIAPMAGDDIKKWNLPLWLLSYILVLVTYIYLNFTVYA